MIDKHVIISLFHIIIVVPFFAYIFINKSSTPEWAYTLLFSLGIIVLLFHFYKSVVKFMAQSNSLWINVVHVVAVAPIMIYIGYTSKNTPRPAYEILSLITFAALGYHLYSMIDNLDTSVLD